MKFSLVAIAATLAVANAADCDLSKVRPLLANPDVATCTSESGFSFVPPSKPTAETLPKICASTACKNVLTAVKALGLGDCTLLGLQLETDLLTPLTTGCSGASASSTAKSSGSRAGSSSGNATVTAPKATTATSKANSSTSSNSSSASANTVNTPAATTTPAPTTSTASPLVVAASAAVLAVASAMLV